MKTKMTHSMLWKSLAFVLSLCLLVSALLSLGGVVFLAEEGYYTGTRGDYAESLFFRHTSHEHSYAAWLLHREGAAEPQGSEDLTYLEKMLDPANTNYRYAIYDEKGKWLGGTAPADTAPYEQAQWHGGISQYSAEGQPTYTVISTLDPAMAVEDGFVEQVRLFNTVIAMRYWLIAIAALSLLGMLLLFIYLMCAAGRHPDAEQPVCRALNRIPYDLYVALGVGVIALLTYAVVSIQEQNLGDILYAVFILAECVAVYAVFQALCMSLAARIKCRCLFRNTIIGWLLCQLWRFVKWICRGIYRVATSLPIFWKTILGVGIFLVLQLVFAITANNSGFMLFMLLLLDLVTLGGACAITWQLRKLKAGARALSDGDFNRQIETSHLLPELKKHAESLNGIGIGMGRAIEARMKSERMKTDLITNVSHDLKTPLTAIVSYVDLLEKEKLGETAKEYVAVLDQQAQRLKKLAEDVVEASKASSGTLNVNLQPTDLVEIVNQSIAEYAARLSANGLTSVFNQPETPIVVQADGRLLWRAIDNLLSNAAKYALPGTRVYIRATGDGSAARLSVKNVSKEPLNVDPAELTERFVRGDASRSADGSGLGLSIAQSLLALQHGSLSLSIDGDLFKAEILLPLTRSL